MNMRPRWSHLFWLLLLLMVPTLTQAQAVAQVWITQINTSAFPNVQVNLLAAAGNGTPLTDLSGLVLSENGTAVSEVQTSSIPVGVETVLVIDANSTINQRDTGATQNRREQVRDSIVAFAQQYMNASQLDRVHLLVPNAASDAPEFLTDTPGAVFANEVINKINFYVPEDPSDTPLNDMLLAAIERLASSDGQRYRAIVLYSGNGAEFDSLLAIDDLVAQAQANHIAFYGLILGSRADADEIENLVRLVEPTGGTYLHMPAAADSAPLYQSLSSFGQQTQLTYRSQLNTSGDHTISINVAGLTAEIVTNVTIEPAAIQILLDNTQPIIRVAPDTETPLAEMEPLEQSVVAQVSWPDNHPREIAAAALVVNNEDPLAIEPFALNANNQLEFTWDISSLDGGEYELIIQLTDELGLVAESEPLAFNVEIERPVVEAATPETSATTAAPVVEEEPDAEESTASSFLTEQAGLIGIVLGILAILFALFLVVVAFIFFRRRNAAPVPVPAPVPGHAVYSAEPAADATQILMPAFAVQSATASLEALEYAPDHPQPVPLSGNDITIGRDPNHAKVVFQDKSVSRLHARIKLDRGSYVLIDEGSASGTYVNFERVGFTPQPLQDNDEIHIGRVRLRFKTSQKAAQDDRTQIFDAPGRGPRPSAPPPPQADDNMSTEYFQQQPNLDASPARPQSPSSPAKSSPPPPSGGNADDVSTQPFMPHQPKKR